MTFASSICNVCLSRERLVVILEKKIHVFDINGMKILRTIETESNPKGLGALSPKNLNYFGYPYGSEKVGDIMLIDSMNSNPVNVIRAHKSPIAIMQYNQDGTMLATASTKVLDFILC